MLEIGVTVLLLLGNAFFVGGEFALIASRATVLEPLAGTSAQARLALSAMSQLPLMIAGAQLGVTICSLGLGAIAEPAIAHYLEVPFHALHVPEPAVHPIAFTLALGLVVGLHTVIGEMVPKNITLAGPEPAALWLGPAMLVFCTATKPLLLAMKWASRQLLRIWGIETADTAKTVFTADELAGLASQAQAEGLLGHEEHARITGALALSRQTAADALHEWLSVVTVSEDVSPASLEVLSTRTGRSRFPVVQRSTRRVLGFIHVKDILGYEGPARRRAVPTEIVRPLAVVPPDRTLADLLIGMRRERQHMVLVSDGRAPLGILTLDDVLTAVVGGDLA